MLCRAVQGRFPKLVTSGLCHSVQGTASMLAKWIGAPENEIEYTCAGINHQAFYTQFLWNGKDAYPLIKKAITENPEIYNDLIEKYCTHGTGWNPGVYAYILGEYRNRETTWKTQIEEWFQKPVELERGKEYAASIFNAIFGDGTLFKFNGNVRNFGLIDNLPYGCCVEVPVLASKRGLEPIHVGKMPPQCALLSGTNAQIEEMVDQAICYDPLTASVLSLREIRDMVDEMFRQNEDWLPQFKK